MIEDSLTHKIIGCTMEVHNLLGNGFQEVIYQRALAIELKSVGIGFVREQEMPLFYKGHEPKHRMCEDDAEGTRRAWSWMRSVKSAPTC